MIDKIEVGKCYYCSYSYKKLLFKAERAAATGDLIFAIRGGTCWHGTKIYFNNLSIVEDTIECFMDCDLKHMYEIPEDDFDKILKAHSLYMSTATSLAERIRNTALQHEN